MRYVLVLIFAFGLAACQTTYIGNEDSPAYVVPTGSRAILNRALTIPPDRAGVYLQDGQVVAPGQIRSYYPHCKLEARRPLGAAQTVNPDEFVITRVSRVWANAVDAGTVLYADASRALRMRASSDQDSGPSIRAFVTNMDLRSDKQPDVSRLVCAQWGYPHEDRHVTLKEIRRALGDVITLRLADARK